MKTTEIKTFGIVGGDKRQLFLAKSISDNCYDVILGGFDRLESNGFYMFTDVKTAIFESDVVIFPLPSVCTDGTINMPFSEHKTKLTDSMIDELKRKPVFVAMRSRFLRAYPQLKNAEIYDYSEKEEFAVANALLTAEGAIEVAMKNYEGTISGSKCFVCGFGRIGKLIANMLKALNADVTVSARNSKDFAYIKALGYKAVNTEKLKNIKGYDLVFNTVPVIIFNSELLMNTDQDTIIIDLASLPGGVDFEVAEKLKIDAIRALSLPGKCSPKSAGEIIKNTVFNIIKEVYR